MPKSNPDKWRGLPLDLLKKFRLKYCRLLTRKNPRPEDPAEVAGDRVGSLVREMHGWLKTKHLKDFPTLTDLGEACDPKVKLNVLNKFFNGNATKGTHWFKNGRDMLRLMLVGSKVAENSEEYQIYKTIEEYFFRGLKEDDPDKSTPFFRGSRRTAEPWTRRELAGEILFTLYKHELAGWPAELVWVSGGWPIFPEGAGKHVASATAEAARSGVQVTFLHHSALSKPRLIENLGDFYETYPAAKGDRLAEIDLARKEYQEMQGWFNFVNPVTQYLYLKVTCPDPAKTDDNVAILYIVRGARLTKEGQAAHLADPVEQQVFEMWLDQIRRAGSPSPTEKTRHALPH